MKEDRISMESGLIVMFRREVVVLTVETFLSFYIRLHKMDILLWFHNTFLWISKDHKVWRNSRYLFLCKAAENPLQKLPNGDACFYMLTESYHFFLVSATVGIEKFAPKTPI